MSQEQNKGGQNVKVAINSRSITTGNLDMDLTSNQKQPSVQ